VPLIWITGNSGAGKSTVCEVLRERGYVTQDADEDGFSRWVDRVTGDVVDDPPYPVPPGWLDRFGWQIDRELVNRLAQESRVSTKFLCGSAENEVEVRDLFDVTVCLVIDDETLRRRLASRTSNAFGQNPEELAAALKWNPRTEWRYRRRGAAIVDATEPISVVADRILALAAISQLRET
jgi:AAA domain